jgi:hypothetical protein
MEQKAQNEAAQLQSSDFWQGNKNHVLESRPSVQNDVGTVGYPHVEDWN